MSNKKDEALKLALECVEAWDRGCDRDPYWRDIEAAVTAIKEALAEQPASGLNPLWVATHPDGLTTPQPSKPLTDEQIERCMKQAYATTQGRNLEHAFARAIEQAHGITGEQK